MDLRPVILKIQLSGVDFDSMGNPSCGPVDILDTTGELTKSRAAVVHKYHQN